MNFNSVSYSNEQVQRALNALEFGVNKLSWASTQPQQIPLANSATLELAAAQQNLANLDLSSLLSQSKTRVQSPVHTRVQPIINPLPAFPVPEQHEPINEPMRTENLIKSQNNLIMQSPVLSKSPIVSSKSPLAQALLSRGMESMSDQVKENLAKKMNENNNFNNNNIQFQQPINSASSAFPQQNQFNIQAAEGYYQDAEY